MVANGEAIHCLRKAGVPEEQLVPVAGGERIPLFTHAVRQQARNDPSMRAAGPPGAPIAPLHTLAALSVHVWPSLHCLMPEGHPQAIDTATVYTGSATPYSCTLDITYGMKHGLLRLGELVAPEKLNEGQRSFVEYVSDRERNVFSHCDGGQLSFNFVIGDKALLWSAHLGAYEGVMKDMEPKPDVAILAIAGRANLNGRPFDGSAAQFAVKEVHWLGSPSTVIWALHDDRCVAVTPRVATGAQRLTVPAQLHPSIPNRYGSGHGSGGGGNAVQSNGFEARRDRHIGLVKHILLPGDLKKNATSSLIRE